MDKTASPWEGLLKDGRANAGVAQLAELIESPASRPKASLSECLAIARQRLRGALTTAGIAEQRAMVTGNVSDAEKLAEALGELDAAYSTMWAYEAASAKVRVHDIDARRAELRRELERLLRVKRAAMDADGGGSGEELGGVLGELASTHAQLSRLVAPTEDASRFPRPVADADADADPPEEDAPPVAKAKAVRDRLRKNGRLAATGGGGGSLRSSATGSSAGRMLRLRSRRAVV